MLTSLLVLVILVFHFDLAYFTDDGGVVGLEVGSPEDSSSLFR